MVQSKEKLNELASKLRNRDSSVVIESIGILRESDPFEGAIGLLVNHYENCSDQLVKQSIAGFLNDIKDNGAKAEIIDSIIKAGKEETKSMVITSCWMCGLDYSDRVDDFLDLFLDAGYSLAFECLTVIEQSVEHLDSGKRSELISMIRNSMSLQPEEKKALVNEMINILSDDYQIGL